MRKRLGLSSSQSVRRLPLPPDLRDAMKKELRRVAVDHAEKRAAIRRACREAVAAAKQERNSKLARIDEEAGSRSAAIRDEYETKASRRRLESQVETEGSR